MGQQDEIESLKAELALAQMSLARQKEDNQELRRRIAREVGATAIAGEVPVSFEVGIGEIVPLARPDIADRARFGIRLLRAVLGEEQ